MSHKITAFRAVVGMPLTKRDFTLVSTALIQSSLLVQAATFPTESVQEVAVPVKGQSVYTPTKKYLQSGLWNFDVPDNSFTTVRLELMSAYYLRKSFSVILIPGNFTDIIGAGSFGGAVFTLLESLGALANAVQLESCFIKDVPEIQFSSSDVTSPVMWRVSVRYNGITPLIPLV